MSQNALATSPINTLSAYLDARKGALAAVMPNVLKPERVLKIILSACSRNPKLLECEPASIYSCLHTAAQLGLELGGPLGHAYPVPFRNNKTGKVECTFIAGYRGLIDLARRSGQISTLYAYAVREGDKFDFELGLDPVIKHKPISGMDKNITHVYAVAHLRDGGKQFQVMTRSEVDAIRARSKSKDAGPWVTDFESMAIKTVIKRLCKYLPASVELAEAIAQDADVDEDELKNVTGSVLESATETAPKALPTRTETAKALMAEKAKPQDTPKIDTPLPPPATIEEAQELGEQELGEQELGEQEPQEPFDSLDENQAQESPAQESPAQEAPPPAEAKKRGRPAGSKNNPKQPEAATAEPTPPAAKAENSDGPEVETQTGKLAKVTALQSANKKVSRFKVMFAESADPFYTREATAEIAANAKELLATISSGKSVTVTYLEVEGKNIIQTATINAE